MRTLAALSFILTSLLLPHQAWGFGIAAVVKFDLSEGWIRVEPHLMNIGVGTGASARNRCIGLCINFSDPFGSKQRASEQDSASNSYFFLLGDPDDLYLALFSFSCAKGRWLVSAHTALEKIRFVRGEIKMQGHLATNRGIVAPVMASSYPWFMENLRSYNDYLQKVTPRQGFPAEKPEDYVNEICTDEFKQKMAAHRLPTLAPRAGENGIFQQEYRNNVIRIEWDAANYLDKVERRSLEILNRVHEVTGGSPEGAALPYIKPQSPKRPSRSRDNSWDWERSSGGDR
ncbi:MAG: hypothetical protein H6624_06585 [Bdellovibrionaceae bacterium]|nr:hypothetical protein [Bdellovibrionales bacterium]MCB9083991.1 hypothetical protein [Pseudobdellovibrionaceae bacterium]